MRDAVGFRAEETTLLQLREAAEELGLSSAAVRWTAAIPEGIAAPAILPVSLPNGQKHFATLVRSHGDQMLVIDFPNDPLWVDRAYLRERYKWDGTALYIAANEHDLAAVRAETGIRWRYVATGTAAGVAVLAVSFRRRRRPAREAATVEGSVA